MAFYWQRSIYGPKVIKMRVTIVVFRKWQQREAETTYCLLIFNVTEFHKFWMPYVIPLLLRSCMHLYSLDGIEYCHSLPLSISSREVDHKNVSLIQHYYSVTAKHKRFHSVSFEVDMLLMQYKCHKCSSLSFII